MGSKQGVAAWWMKWFIVGPMVGLCVLEGGCGLLDRGVLVIAHRGDSGRYPENTLASFRGGLDARADMIELDARVTKDGVLIVMHDETLGRTTSASDVLGAGEHRVDQIDSVALSGLDAGSWKDSSFAGEGVPALGEAVALITAGATVLVERKSGSPQRYADSLRAMGRMRGIVVQSFDWAFLAALRIELPRLRLAGLGDGEVTLDRINALRAMRAVAAAWNHKDLDERAVRRFHDAGIVVWAYTVNRPRDWDRLCRIGVDGIITDHPSTCRAWLESRGRR